MLILIAWIAAGVMAIWTVALMWNLQQWVRLNGDVAESIARTCTGGSSRKLPFVSVLVPARNEERSIAVCVQSLLKQRYENYEVIVLDDRSEDGTRMALARLASDHPRLAVIDGSELEPGWAGKNFACARLAAAAKGEWLLFVDADTVHAPDMLSSALAAAVRRGSGLLTGFPRIVSSHTLGWLVLPLLHFVISLHLPIRWVERSPLPRFAAAHGAFMLYRRDVYAAIGGHGHPAHRAALVEDMTMAAAVKRAGYRLTLADITPYVSCDMYEYPHQIWNGFAKNIYNGLGRRWTLLAGIVVFYVALYIAPLPGILAAASAGHLALSPPLALIAALGWTQKALVDSRFNVSGPWFLAMPVSAALLVLLAVRSWWLSFRRIGYEWKGRVYSE